VTDPTPEPAPHQRRKRYSGRNPQRFEDKYKELDPAQHADTIAKVLASGKTPAGMHVPIMVNEILTALDLHPGMHCVDCTLGYGGHASEILGAIQPGGQLLGLDQDPIELERTSTRLSSTPGFIARRMNFAGLPAALSELGWTQGADAILADLGISSMQIDNPARGFSFKHDGPLDMRMNPQRGLPASALLARASIVKLTEWLTDHSDEPRAKVLGEALAGQSIATTRELQRAILAALPRSVKEEDRDLTVRRVFQALRIAVNEEFTALDTWLRALPSCLRSGGRVAVLTFHSGEDRRVKKAFQSGTRDGTYTLTNDEVIRASSEELRLNPRASSAKLRWAVRA
jgi:16S rRNA (cytosine1402-N4)-methyltransferase